jgi:hypothetical protein
MQKSASGVCPESEYDMASEMEICYGNERIQRSAKKLRVRRSDEGFGKNSNPFIGINKMHIL